MPAFLTRFSIVVFAMVTLLLSGCGHDSNSAPDTISDSGNTPSDMRDGDGDGDGGTVDGSDANPGNTLQLGNWQLAVEQDEDGVVLFETLPALSSSSTTDNVTLDVVTVDGDQAAFEGNVTIVYEGAEATGVSDTFAFARASENGWTILPGSRDDGQGSVTAPIATAGTYALVTRSASGLIIPPELTSVAADPAVVVSGVDTDVTLTWEFRFVPTNAPNCTLADSDQELTSGAVVSVNTTEPTDITVVCTSDDGTTMATASIALAVAPKLQTFRASPPFVAAGKETAVSWSWDYANAPVPAPTCSVSSIGAVENEQATNLTLSLLPLPVKTYTLTCENAAGSATRNINVTALPDIPISITLTPEGSHHSLLDGLVELDVPAGAVTENTTITARIAADASTASNIFGVPITFSPEGLQFAEPLSLSFYYPSALAEAFGITQPLVQLGFSTDAGSAWNAIASEVVVDENRVTGLIHHFSNYAATARRVPNTPLYFEKTTLAQNEEVAIFTPGGSSAVWDFSVADLDVDDDENAEPNEFQRIAAADIDALSCDGKWIATQAGDVNGDGVAEIVALCRTSETRNGILRRDLELKVYGKDGSGNWKRLAYRTVSDLHALGESPLRDNDSYYGGGIALANVDSDPEAEIALLANYGRHNSSGVTYKRGGIWWIIELRDDALVSLSKNTARQQQSFSDIKKSFACDVTERKGRFADLTIAAGDINAANRDNDSVLERDEIVIAARYIYSYNTCLDHVASQNRAYVYQIRSEQKDGNTDITSVSLLHRFDHHSHKSSKVFDIYYSRPNVAVGDYDRDGVDEIAFVAVDDHHDAWLETYEGNQSGDGKDSWVRQHQTELPKDGQRWSNSVTPQIVATDITRSFDDELVMLLADEKQGDRRWLVTYYPQSGGNSDRRIVDTGARAKARLATGDLDSDGFSEVLVAYASEDGDKYWISRWAHDPSRASGERFYKIGSASISAHSIGTPAIAAGDFDQDNTVVEYVGGDPERTRTGTIVLSVLRPPPFWQALYANGIQDAGAISFTSTESTSTSKTMSHGVHAGVAVTFGNFTDGWGPFSVGAGVGFGIEGALTWSNTKGVEMETATTLAQTVPFDGKFADWVTFTTIPYLRYWYRVLSHGTDAYKPGSSDCQEQVDPTTGLADDYCYIAINVPNESSGPTIGGQTVEKFNSNRSGTPPKIDEPQLALQQDVGGNPRAYVSREEAQDLAAPVEMYKGDNSSLFNTAIYDTDSQLDITPSVSLFDYVESGFAMEWAIDLIFEGQASGVSVTANVGYHGERAVTLMAGSGTTYGATVAGIPCGDSCFNASEAISITEGACAACYDLLVDGDGKPIDGAPTAFEWGMFVRQSSASERYRSDGDSGNDYMIMDFWTSISN